MSTLLEVALEYARLGWHVFPIGPRSKVPLTKHGFKDATTDEPQLVAWWTKWPTANIGIATGEKSGFFVADRDDRHGGDKSLAELEATHGALPITWQSLTGGGGAHYFFAYVDGIKNRTSVLSGIDIRGDGGYIVAPFSVHESGNTYVWAPGRAPNETKIAAAPDWFLELVRTPVLPKGQQELALPAGPATSDEEFKLVSSCDGSLVRRMEAYVAKVPPAKLGARNDSAFRLAGNLVAMRDSKGYALAPEVIYSFLLDWNEKNSPPLERDELLQCFFNSMTNGTLPSFKFPKPKTPPVEVAAVEIAAVETASLEAAKEEGSSTEPERETDPGAFERAQQRLNALISAKPSAPTQLSPLQKLVMPPPPQPIINNLRPVAPFDLDLLPASMTDWIEDVGDRIQCPRAFLGVTLLVALATVVGRRITIRPKRYDDWIVVPNLWGALIGRPGILKTPAVQEVLKVLTRLEVAAKKQYVEDLKKYEDTAVIAKEEKKLRKNAVRDALESGADAQAIASQEAKFNAKPPSRVRYMANDATVEKLGEILAENPNGLLIFRDELSGFLRGLEKDGQETARAFVLESWNGSGRFTYDRIGRGTTDIEATTLSIIGCIQPGPLSQYLQGTAMAGRGDDGLIQRFQLAVWPDVSKDWENVDRYPNNAAKNRAFAVFERLSKLSASGLGAQIDEYDSDSLPFVHFTDEAQRLFDEWRKNLETRVRGDTESPQFESHISKYRSLIPSIALLLHVADEQHGSVGREYLDKAIRWGVFLESHAQRIYGFALNADHAAAHALARKVLSGDFKDGFTLRDVYRAQWAGLPNRDLSERAVAVLVDHDWLIEQKPGPGVGAKVSYKVNPAVRTWKSPDGQLADAEPESEDL